MFLFATLDSFLLLVPKVSCQGWSSPGWYNIVFQLLAARFALYIIRLGARSGVVLALESPPRWAGRAWVMGQANVLGNGLEVRVHFVISEPIGSITRAPIG